MNQYFGDFEHLWPEHLKQYLVPTPVGQICANCGEPIAENDSGLITNMVSHRECFLRGVFGSVGHQNGRCSCYGGDEDDPPGMTKRQAAWAAVKLWELRRA